MIRALLAFPGDLATPTGGYAYDREVLARLPAWGIDIAPVSMPEGFPFPSPPAIEAALRTLEATDPATILLVDGLALGALPAPRLVPLRRRLVALVHHPLALEDGLEAEAVQRLRASETAVLCLGCPVITTSHPTARTLAADYGVAAARITVAEPGTHPAPRAQTNGVPPRLLAVGSVISRKGYRVLIEALSTLADLPWTLTIVGGLAFDPAEASAVRTAITAAGLEARISLAGAATPEALEVAYGASDIFVHPSLYEGYGMVLAEALRRGLPLVCTTGGAAAETVPDGAGLKVAPGDAAAFAAALRGLLADPEARRRLADRAFAAGERLPTWDDTAKRIAEVLSATAHRQGAAA